MGSTWRGDLAPSHDTLQENSYRLMMPPSKAKHGKRTAVILPLSTLGAKAAVSACKEWLQTGEDTEKRNCRFSHQGGVPASSDKEEGKILPHVYVERHWAGSTSYGR